MIELHCTRRFDEKLATKLGDVNAAIIISQLDYWIRIKKDCHYGVTFEGDRYIYNSFATWVQEQFAWLTEWKFRESMKLLRNLKLVKVERLKKKQWDQTNHYTLDYQALANFQNDNIPEAETIEKSDLRSSTPQEDKTRTTEIEETYRSFKDQGITDKEKTNKKKAVVHSFENGKNTADSKENVVTPREAKTKLVMPKKQPAGKGSEIKIVNAEWSAHMERAKKLGVEMNSTVIKYLKTTELEIIENAIAALEEKVLDTVPNINGFFIQAIKSRWMPNYPGRSVAPEKNDRGNNSKKFRQWLRLAQKFGYCSEHEYRDGKPWVMVMGSWQSFKDAIATLTLEYLLKMQNRGT